MSSEMEDIERRLDEIEEKVGQSYKILRSVKRRQTLDTWFGIIKLVVLLGGFYYAFQFAQPYVQQVLNAYASFESFASSTRSISAKANIFQFFNQGQ